MKSFWDIVNKIIRQSDIVIEVLDARFVEKTRNRELEDKVHEAGKVLLYVINKCDLVDKDGLEKYKKSLKPCVFVSSTLNYGTTLLRQEIMRQVKWKEAKIGVVGYPNVGKSSLINTLKGKKAAPSSSQSGFTKALQNIRISEKIILVDSPGVIPYEEKSPNRHAEISAIDYSKIKDPDTQVYYLMKEYPKIFEKHYGIPELKEDDYEKILEDIARKMGFLKKGGEPHIEAAARLVLMDWQRGKINIGK